MRADALLLAIAFGSVAAIGFSLVRLSEHSGAFPLDRRAATEAPGSSFAEAGRIATSSLPAGEDEESDIHRGIVPPSGHSPERARNVRPQRVDESPIIPNLAHQTRNYSGEVAAGDKEE